MGDRGSIGGSLVVKEDAIRFNEFLHEISEKYHVDNEEILIGISDFPPNDPCCLVYIQYTPFLQYEYFRKNLQVNGRWICWNKLSQGIEYINERGKEHVENIFYLQRQE